MTASSGGKGGTQGNVAGTGGNSTGGGGAGGMKVPMAGMGGMSGAGGMMTAGAGGGPTGTGGTKAPVGGPDPINLPTPSGTCEDFHSGVMMFKGIAVDVSAGPATGGGALVFYWHGTGTSSAEAGQALDIGAITGEGGIVASFIDTTSGGIASGGTIWFQDDLPIADEIVACAIEKQKIDPHRIHSSGYSAGGLQTGAMLTQRSNYMASGLVYSGGVIASQPDGDPSNAPALMCAHGALGSDQLGLDFAQGCMDLEDLIVGKGGFAIDCDDGSSHIDTFSRFSVASFGTDFLMTHTFKVKPEPWASSLPGAPATCKIWKK